mmetsp:Transcript_5550/g.9500  ORF Transcript_5550/g.9500 Transcript_5550/m.9500 type:complete len:94 (+) Transcript_5550:2906-3187(+)
MQGEQNQSWLARQWNNTRNWFPRIRFTLRYMNGGNHFQGTRVRRHNPEQMQQAISRIREIFPQLTNTEIERELNRAGGIVEVAILQISSRFDQ